MAKELTKEILDYLEASAADAETLLEELCGNPAPSHHEDERAAFVKNWLDGIGAEGVYIDSAKNVVLPLNCESNVAGGVKQMLAALLSVLDGAEGIDLTALREAAEA